MRLSACCALLALGIFSGCASRHTVPASRAAQVAAPTNPPAAKTSSNEPVPAGTIQLFDGKTLKGWRISDFAGSGQVRIEDGKLILEMGTMTGVTYTNEVPTMNYEISVDAMRVDGSD